MQTPVLHTQPSLESINNIFTYKKIKKHKIENPPTVSPFCLTTFPFFSLPDKKKIVFSMKQFDWVLVQD